MSAAIHANSKERVLSPKRREDFRGELVILNEGNQDVNDTKNRPLSGSKQVIKRPSSGTLEVLKSENISAESSKESAKNSAQLSSSRVEKRLPVVKRKEDSCSCTAKITCKKCKELDLKMKDLSVEGFMVNDSNIKTRDCMAPRAAPSQRSIAVASYRNSGQNTEDSEESEASSSSEDDDDDAGNGGGSQRQPVKDANLSSSKKAPLELLGLFLDALMKKDYETAQKHCDDILLIEPANSTCLEFRSKLKEKLNLDDDSNSDDSDDEDDDDSSGEDDDSDEDSSQSGSGSEDNADEESDDDDLRNINVNKLNLLVGGVPVNK